MSNLLAFPNRTAGRPQTHTCGYCRQRVVRAEPHLVECPGFLKLIATSKHKDRVLKALKDAGKARLLTRAGIRD